MQRLATRRLVAADTAAWCRRLELAAAKALEGARSNQPSKAGGWVCPMTGYRHGKSAGAEAGPAWLESAFTTYDTAQLLQVSHMQHRPWLQRTGDRATHDPQLMHVA